MDGRIIEIICNYRRRDIDPRLVEVVADAQIVDLYAARVAGPSDYLVRVGEGIVEEVAFDTWPPSGGMPESADPRPGGRGGLRVEQVLSESVRYCTAGDSLEQAARLMWDHDCGCVPVCAEDDPPRVVGMLTDRDICMSALLQGKRLAEVPVADAMSRDVRWCRPADSVADAERAMRERRVRRLPVVDEDGRLVGIVSLADLARTFGGRRALAARAAGDVEVGETLAAIVDPENAAAAA